MLLFAVVPAAAANLLFVQIGDVQGDSTEIDHENWIKVFGLSHGASTPVAPGSGKGTEPPDFTVITFLKSTDKATHALHLAAASGSVYPDAFIDVCRDVGGGPPECFYRLHLQGVRISAIEVAGGSCIDPSDCGGALTEKVELAFTAIE